MRHIWSLFKFFETAGGMFSLAFHIYGVLRSSNDYDHEIYSIAFTFGTIATMISHLEICVDKDPTAQFEAIFNSILGCLFLYTAMLTMYHCEDEYDVYFLQKLSSHEILRSFKFYKAQSLAALTTGGIHILHSTLAIDVCLSAGKNDINIPDEEITPTGPIRMYIVNATVNNWLMQFEWFQRWANIRVKPETNDNDDEGQIDTYLDELFL